MSLIEKSPVVRIQIPDGFPEDVVEKALGVTARALKTEHKPTDNFKSQNPAAKALMEYVDDSYNTMVASLAKEIKKVFEEG